MCIYLGRESMGVELMLIAALFIAASNYCMRRSIDAGGSSRAYFVVQLTLIFLVAILLNPVRTGEYAWSPGMAYFGVIGGVVLGVMLLLLGRALELGPPGLTFATLNASTVMPMILMVICFGASFGYVYTMAHGLGSFLVILGLFWAGRDVVLSEKKVLWVACALGAFLLHVIFLVLMQWRALFMNFPGVNGLLLPFTLADAKSQWFMPMVFLSAAVVHTFFYLLSQPKRPRGSEVGYGILGGVTNGIGTFFMIWSTEVSTPKEHAMIFPLFAITVILCCNTWGKWLYQERVNWWANACCVAGIVVGTLDWRTLLT